MAITTDFLTGFEYGLASTSGVGLFDSLNAACTITSTSGEYRNGSYAGKLTYAASAITFNKVAADQTKTKGLVRVAFKVVTEPSVGNVAGVFTSRRVDVAHISAEVNSSGQIQVQHTTGSVVTGPAVNDSAWHILELQFDSGTAGTLDWKVDGVSQTQATGSTTSSNIASWRCGSLRTNTAGTIVVDDWICGFWTSTSDWYGDGKIVKILPSSDGTHSFTANDFSTGDAGTQRSSGYTDFYTMVDDAPPWTTTRSTTDNIAQRVTRTTGYVEIKHTMASVTEPLANAVRSLLAYSSSATQANTMGAIVRNSTPTAHVLWGDLPTAQGGNNGALADYSESSNFFKSVMVTKPAAGWTSAEINAIRWRIGGSDDPSPVPTVQALMLEIDYPTNPTVVLNTTDGTAFGSNTTPTLEFTGTDQQGDDLRYELQVSNVADFNDIGAPSSAWTVFNAANAGVGESFNALYNFTLGAAKFYLKKTGTPTGNAVAKLYAHTGTYGTGGLPTGTALAVSDNFDVSTLTTSFASTSISFTGVNQYSGTTDTKYVIAFEYVGGSVANSVEVGANGSHDGNVVYLASGVWEYPGGAPLNFYVVPISISPIAFDKVSSADAGFVNTVNGANTEPFTSGQKVSYTIQAENALTTGTYYWRARAIDPTGGNVYGVWTTSRSFTIATGGGSDPVSAGSFFPFM